MSATASTEVWLVDLAASAAALADCERRVPRLSSGDIDRIASHRDTEARAQRATAAIALRIVLERRFGAALRGVDLPRERLGRPGLPDGRGGAFSLSHCDGLAMIGVTTAGRIGVDLEVRRTVRMAERRRQVIETAAETLVGEGLTGDGDDRFLQAWVVLEALAKADGRGIGHLLTRLGAVGGRNGASDAAVVLAQELEVKVCVLQVGLGRFAAVAGAGDDCEVLRFPNTVAGIDELIGG